MVARTAATAVLLAVASLVASTPQPEVIFQGPVLGASLFRAAWAYKHDRPWLESQLRFLQRHRFDAIRAFGTVGDPERPDYWDGREIDARWAEYDEVIAGLTDLAFDRYGIRVQWTIFADAQKSVPDAAMRQRIVERFVRLSRGRERKILAFEVANEFWQNGFEGEAGVRQLEALARRLREATDVPVAASAHADDLCGLYSRGAVDFATVHFDRTAPHARWSPLLEPWATARQPGRFARCALPAIASNNEPLGAGSSVSSSLEPLSIVMSAVNTWLAGVPVYIFHSGPGVRDDPSHPEQLRPSSLSDLPGAERIFGGLAAAREYVPADLPAWRSFTPAAADFPFEPAREAVVQLGVVRGSSFTIGLAGLPPESQLTARRQVHVRVLDPLTGKTVQERSLKPGEALTIAGEAAVLAGTMPQETKP